MITKTDAVVLRSMKYRDTSRIVTFYTREFGKLAGIVKGARQARNKFGAALQPMAYVSLVLYKKDGRALQTITQCDLMKLFRSLTEDLEKMAVGMAMIELISNIAHEEEGNAPLFAQVVESLTALNQVKSSPAKIFFHFELRLAAILGFRPVFDTCIRCNRPASVGDDDINFHLEKGGLVCAGCKSGMPGQLAKLRGNSHRIMSRIQKANADSELESLEFDLSTSRQIETMLQRFLRQHVTGVKALKSERVFAKILLDS